ncbi:MAG: hypothetical protein ACLRFE_03670 [Clostridia bacterium]
MNKFKILFIDIFFVISGIVGVGFVTGKEISHYFVAGKSVIVASIIFGIVFVILSWFILHIKHRFNICNLTSLNKFAFGRYYEIGDMVLTLVMVVTSSAMLAGCDNLVNNYLNIHFPLVSVILSIITFVVMFGGIRRVRKIASVMTPIIIIMIIINALSNSNAGASQVGNLGIDFAFPIVFACHNFVTLIAVLFNCKSKPSTLSLVSAILLTTIILISSFALVGVDGDMPMLALSKGMGNVFFVLYLWCVVCALFTTLQISTYSCWQVLSKPKTNRAFTLMLVIITSQIIANLGFDFIVRYLYFGIGIFSAIYLIMIIISLIIQIRKFK